MRIAAYAFCWECATLANESKREHLTHQRLRRKLIESDGGGGVIILTKKEKRGCVNVYIITHKFTLFQGSGKGNS